MAAFERNALLLASMLALAGCGEDTAPVAPPARSDSTPATTRVAEPVAAAGADVTPGAAAAELPVPEDAPEPVAEYVAIAPTCSGPGGDRRAAREQLRAIGRSADDVPPDVAPLLTACASTPTQIASALHKGGLAAMRRRAYEPAARWFGAALRTDPSHLDARLALVGALSKAGGTDDALEQLQVIQGAGEAGAPVLERALRDRYLADLRQRQGFWALVPAPVPLAITAFDEGATDDAYAALSIDEELDPEDEPQTVDILGSGEEPDLLWSRVRLERSDFNAIGRAISHTLGSTFTRFTTARESDYTAPWVQGLERLGVKLLTAPVMWRPVEGRELFLMPLAGDFDGQRTFVLLIAESVDGELLVSSVTTQTSCEQPPAFLHTSDHRSVGWTLGCASYDDPAQVDRCMLYVSEGALVRRCGTGALAPAAPPPEAPAEPIAAGGTEG